MSDAENSKDQPDCLVEQRGHTLIVTMNRPEARNALSGEMMAIMVEAWDRVDNDPEIRSCILTGAGGYFCAGMDLKGASKKPPGDSFKDGSYDPSRIDGLLKGRRLTKPLIAAVEGAAIAALIIGIARSVAIHVAPWAEMFIIYLVLAIVLAIRPQGIFAPTEVRKI